MKVSETAQYLFGALLRMDIHYCMEVPFPLGLPFAVHSEVLWLLERQTETDGDRQRERGTI